MNCDYWNSVASHPNCKECPRYMDDCDGDDEAMEPPEPADNMRVGR